MNEEIKYTFVDGDSVPNLIHDGVTPEMTAHTNAKFAQWDKVIATDQLSSEKESDQKYVYGLLDDPTIYVYSFFRNVKGEPIKLYPYQDVVLNATHNRILVPSSNQSGKSFSLCCKALTFAFKTPGATILLVSKAVSQSKDLIKQMRDLLKMSTLDYKSMLGDVDTKTELYIKHYDDDGKELLDSRIICAPANESALGFPVDLLLLDEVGFYTEPDGEYFYYQVAQPRLYHTKGQCIAYSNPNGTNNIVYTLWMSKQFHKYRFTFLDNPRNTKEEFDRLCEEMPQAQIESTLMAKFTASEGQFISSEEIEAMQEERMNAMIPKELVDEPFFLAYDFAKVNDRTVVTTGYKTKDNGIFVPSMYEYPAGTGYDIVIDNLKQIVEDYGVEKIAGVGYDGTGVGKGIEDFMRVVEMLGIPLIPIGFTTPKKSAMATILKLLIEKNIREPEKTSGIKVPKDKEFAKQMKTIVFKKSGSNLVVHHEKDSDRDDYFDSLMILVDIVMNLSNIPVSVEIVQAEVRQMLDDANRCECGNILEGEQFCSFCGIEVVNWFI